MSEGLSKRLSGTHNVMNNAEAKQFDQMLKRLIPEIVLPRLRQMYPEYEWDHVTRVYQHDYVYMTNPSYVPSNPNSHIAPDGGVVLCNCIPVLITEAKKQGTNTKRMQEGKKRQSRGNAIERAHRLGKKVVLAGCVPQGSPSVSQMKILIGVFRRFRKTYGKYTHHAG